MFWDTFEKLCKQAGKKPSPVGKEIGVSATAVSKWREGTIPNGEILIKIADYFNVSIDYLLGRTEERNSERVIFYSSDSMPESKLEYPNSDRVIFYSSGPMPENKPQEQPEPKDSIKDEFVRAFAGLDLEDKIAVMSFTMERMKKGA